MNKFVMVMALIIINIALPVGALSQAAPPHLSEGDGADGMHRIWIANSTIMILPNTNIQIINSSSVNISGINLNCGILDHLDSNNSYKTVGLHNEDEDLLGTISGASPETDVSLIPISISRDSGNLKISPKTAIKNKVICPTENGSMPFSLGKIAHGGYILEAKEANGSVLLVRMPILVQRSLEISLPKNISPGDVLQVDVLAKGSRNLTVGAIVMPVDDYNLTNITVSDKITIKRGDISAEVKKMDAEDVVALLPILPEDCTLTYQLQEGDKSTLNLITDADWQKGRYTLICMAYDQSGIRIAQGFLDLV